MAARDEALAALSVYYNHAQGAYGYSDELIERMKCVIDTVAARVRAEAMEETVEHAIALIAACRPEEANDVWEAAYREVAEVHIQVLRSLINKASEGDDSKEKQ